MFLLIRLFLNALAVMAVAYLVPGVSVQSFPSAFIAAIAIALVNALIRPILLILTLPVNILTLGLFTLILNALMFWLASSISPGFRVSGSNISL
jgi:putative membrane protein